MVKVLDVTDMDPLLEELNRPLLAGGVKQRTDDLSDGGRVGNAILFPMEDGIAVDKGRAVALRAWTWNGSETLLPLAWDTAGKVHDAAMHYRRKRFCVCCMQGGFYGRICPVCVKRTCVQCNSGANTKNIVANFYLRIEDVPYPAKFHGKINCFLPMCVRRGDVGFRTEEDMRFHARSRHRGEYASYMESQTSATASEVDSLRKRLDALLGAPSLAQAQPAAATAVAPTVGTQDAPLYVSTRTVAERQAQKRGRPRKTKRQAE